MAVTALNKMIGQRIRVERERCGMTREAFAEQLGLSASFVADLERGKSAPSAETLISLSDVLEMSTDMILLGVERKNNYTTITRHVDKLPPEKLEAVEKIIRDLVEALTT